VTFFALAAYLAAESIHDLVTHARPEQSLPGLAVTAAALLVMPGLAVAKRRTGQALGNRTLIADSAETALSKLSTGATRARKALDAHRKDEPATAFYYLNLLFGGRFPSR